MKKYLKPELNIIKIQTNDIITLSGQKGLTNGGQNGEPMSESYSSLFK